MHVRDDKRPDPLPLGRPCFDRRPVMDAAVQPADRRLGRGLLEARERAGGQTVIRFDAIGELEVLPQLVAEDHGGGVGNDAVRARVLRERGGLQQRLPLRVQ